MNVEILIVIGIVIGTANLVLLLILLFKSRKGGGQTDESTREALRRLEQKTDNIGSLAEFDARTTENLSRSTEARLIAIQNRLADDIKYIVETNAHNLETIRRTVDEKLSSTIDGKLSENYARITGSLEKMYESVGEMKTLSGNVADIKRIFTNVKLRGTWGEAQPDALLAQMLAPDQYRRSVKLNPLDNSLVDFAVLLPAKDGYTYLPIDSKFPMDCFERLCDAGERGDRDGEERAKKELERAVRLQADSIAKKYILPPVTTDFAVMYLPSEALYAEVLKLTGLTDFLRLRRITVSGPTNFAALLSALQTGFRTAAIEKRSGELADMLEQFRADFAKFAEGLEKTKRKLQEAQDAVDGATKRTAVIGKRLDGFRSLTAPALPDQNKTRGDDQ